MLDEDTKRARIIRAALRLAEQKGWRALRLDEIARDAGLTLADLRDEFAGKTAILLAFSREIDRAVLARAAPDMSEPVRDRLFDVIMSRLEVLAPYRPALRRILDDVRSDARVAAALCGASLRAQYWMVTAAGLRADAPEGCLRIPEMAAVYARVIPVWLDDDDPGLARTMAALDRRLRRGERCVEAVEEVCATARRLLCAFLPRRGDGAGRARGATPPPPPPAGSQPAQEPPLAG